VESLTTPLLCPDCLRKLKSLKPYLETLGLTNALCPDCGDRLIEDLTVPRYVLVPRLYCLNCLKEAKEARMKTICREKATLDALREARNRLQLMKGTCPEFLDQIISEERAKESEAERVKNQPFYDFLARALLEGDGPDRWSFPQDGGFIFLEHTMIVTEDFFTRAEGKAIKQWWLRNSKPTGVNGTGWLRKSI
jgi:hypothetical protein